MQITFDTLPQAVTELHSKLTQIERLLLEKSEPTNTTDELLTIQQAGEFLKLSVATLYGYVQRAEIPVSKRGKRLYFSRQELTDWIKAGRKKTVEELQTDPEKNLRKRKGGNV
jgi:excisionase family DNA binding protein